MPANAPRSPDGTQGSGSGPLGQAQALLDAMAGARARLTVLEAGCGSLSSVRMPVTARIVGVDISAEQLERNTTVHEKIQADLQTCDLPRGAYDVVVCWDVLEHLPEPRQALEKLFAGVAPRGLIVLAFPNVLSLKGIVAKFTPLLVHEVVNRFVYGERTHQAAYQVFPTYLRWAIAPQSVVQMAVERGFAVELSAIYESGMQQKFRRKIGLTGIPWKAMRSLVRLLTVGVIDPDGTDCLLVLRRAWPITRLTETVTMSPESGDQSATTSGEHR